MKRKCFYSFHYGNDASRAAQVRNMGYFEDSAPVSDNDWETIKRGGDRAIKTWINQQLRGRTCTIVLVGEHTSERPWVIHEIVESWNRGMGVVGIHINGLKNLGGYISPKGENPFEKITYKDGDFLGFGRILLSEVVKCYSPAGRSSKERYDWIRRHLNNAVEEAIKIRKRH